MPIIYEKIMLMPMDVAQRWDIAESITYIVFKHLWLDINEPSKNSDDRWFDYTFDVNEYDIKLQVKSVKKSEISINGNSIKYDLKVKNNNKLFNYSHQNPHRRSVLMLIVVPEDEETLIWLSDEQLIITCKIYWLNEFEYSNNSGTKRVSIPMENQITQWFNLFSLKERWLA